MKPDERQLLIEMQKRNTGASAAIRALVKELGIPPKRADYIFEKWTNKGWYCYGTVVDGGWLTEKGRAVVP